MKDPATQIHTSGGVRFLPVVLSVIAGSADAISFLGLRLFSAHVTGKLVILTAHLVTGRADNTCLFLSVPIFVLVLCFTRLLAIGLEARRINPMRPLLWLHFLMLGSALIVWAASGRPTAPETRGIVIAGQLSVAAMAVQNGLMDISLKASPTTAVMTTNLVRLIMDAIESILGPDPTEVTAAHHRAKKTWPVVVGFIAGAGLGAACFGALGLNALALPAGLALVAVIIGQFGASAGAKR